MMTFNEITRQCVHYRYVINAKRKGVYKFTLLERIVAKIMLEYYTDLWEHYFDEEE